MGYLIGLQGLEAVDNRAVGAQEETTGTARRIAYAIVSAVEVTGASRTEGPRVLSGEALTVD